MQLPAHTQLWIDRPAVTRTAARAGLSGLIRRAVAALRPTPPFDNPRSHRRAD